MRAVTIACCAALLVGCTKKETPAPPATVSLAGFAGTWQVRGSNEAGDSIVGYQLVASAEPSDWKSLFPNRDPVPLRIVAAAGDSVVTESGPYESVLRKGVQVRTNGVLHLQGGKLVGETVAHYETAGADSVLHIRVEGTRVP